MAEQKNRRKNYFIKKEFQRRFILRFCFLLVLGAVISGGILYRLCADAVTTTFVNSRLSIVSTADYILPALLGSSLIAVILVSAATVLVVMYLSHRIAGPLFKIERSAREVGAGDLKVKVELRSTDEMAKLADCFNEMTENLKNRLLKIRAQADGLGKQIDSLKASGAGGASEDALKKVCEKRQELDKAISYFKA